MVSPWEVYLVMQLDSVVGMFFGGAIISLVALLLCFFAFTADSYGDDEKVWVGRMWRIGVVGALCAIVATLLPSSKTAAAMILIPKLTSPEVMQPVGAEAKELYQLAKGALKRLADEPKK